MNLATEMALAMRSAEAHYGRRALVGQYVRQDERTGQWFDLSARVNFDRSKKYPHSSKRQNERAERQRARRAVRLGR